jgi:hypothetical protein
MRVESSGKPDAGKLARPVWGWGRGAIPRPTPPSARSAPPLEITHEIQLSCYAWLFRQITGEEEAGLEIRSLVKTRQPKIDIHAYPPRSRAHFDRLFAVLLEYLDALDRGRFNFRPGWSCSMCDFRESHCRAWCG